MSEDDENIEFLAPTSKSEARARAYKKKYLKSLRVSDHEELNDLICDIDVMFPKVASALIIIAEEIKK